MISKIVKVLLDLFIKLFVILCLICLPLLFFDENQLSFQLEQYFLGLTTTIKSLGNIDNLTYVTMGKIYPLFPTINDKYLYSLSILFISLAVSLIIAILFSYLFMSADKRTKSIIRAILLFLESIPDIMLIIGIQLFVIWIFQKTNYLPFRIVSLYDEKAYALPVICLSVLPTIQLFKMLTLNLENEEKKPYVEVVKGKGFPKGYIVHVHLFRNVFIYLFNHFKTIYIFMLSNLFILEFVFNMDGIMNFLFNRDYIDQTISFIVIVMLFFPMYLMFFLLKAIIFKWNKKGEITT